MKTIFLTISTLLSVQFLLAQDPIDIITDHACECVKEKDLEGKNQQELQMELGICIIQGLSKVDKETQDSLGIDMTDQSGMYKLGETVGIRMASRCPSELMKAVSSEANAAQQLAPEEDFSDIGTKQVKGKITEVDNTGFTVVSLEAVDGSLLKLVWLRPFEGSEDFMGDPSTLINKQVNISYEELEIYTATVKDYITRKEIVALEIIK